MNVDLDATVDAAPVDGTKRVASRAKGSGNAHWHDGRASDVKGGVKVHVAVKVDSGPRIAAEHGRRFDALQGGPPREP